jgi:hypothetical protein
MARLRFNDRAILGPLDPDPRCIICIRVPFTRVSSS